MTISFEKKPDSPADRILKLFGKERAYVIPAKDGLEGGRDSYVSARQESFWQAMSRGREEPLPDGLIYKKQLEGLRDEE